MRRLQIVAILVALVSGALPASAQVEYRIPGLVDNSGPFADLSKHLVARDAVIKWWNETTGKKLGITLTVKNYDTRYDGTVVASLWPGILSENKPILAMGLGGADVAALQQRLPRDRIFPLAVMGTGAFLVLAASLSEPIFAALAVAAVGACAGTSYVTGFTALQETVHDELRGRTFATLYSVIRLCLLVSLVISPLWSNFWDWVTSGVLDQHRLVNLGWASYAFPGVRIALWGGGLITLAAGWWARHSIGHARRMQRANPQPGPAGAGAT